MTTERDMDGEMKRSGLDVIMADRLLSGDVAAEDAPPGCQLIAEIIQRASHPGPAGESRRERATVAAMVQTLRAAPPASRLIPRRPKIARTRSVKVAAIAAAVVLGATAAGAATNSLPGPLQRAISDAVSHVGVSLPKPASPRARTPGGPNAANRAGNPVGPNAAARAELGLCRAYASGPSTTNPRSGKDSSVALANLEKQAHAAGMSVADYCKKTVIPTLGRGSAPTTDTTLSRGSNTTVPRVSTPHPTGPPVSTSRPSSPPVSTSHPTGPPVTTKGNRHRP